MTSPLQSALFNGISYDAYVDFVNDLVQQEKTSGPKQSPDLVAFTKLNAARMRRLNKTFKPGEAALAQVKALDTPMTWLVITESWCGDAAQILPLVNALAAANPQVTLKHILRDENPAVMDQFLTNGARSIPVVVFIDSNNGEVLGHWGPRPEELQEKVYARKADPNPGPYEEFQVDLQRWYAKDKGRSTEREFLAALHRVTG